MKKLALFLVFFICIFSANAQVVIKATGVKFVGKTQAQRFAIVAPKAGLTVFQTTAPAGLFVFGGTAWKSVNGRFGSATLVAGTVTIADTIIKTASKIFVTVSNPAGTRGFISTSKIPNTSFTITSSSSAETSVVDWWFID